MNSLTGAERKKLKSKAHHLRPVVQIGQKGLTDTLKNAVDKALEAHELIKIKFVGYKEEKKALSEKIALETNAVTIGIIGNIVIMHRKNMGEKGKK